MFSNVTGRSRFQPRIASTAPVSRPATVTVFRAGRSSMRIGAARVGSGSATKRASTSHGPPRTPVRISSTASRWSCVAWSETMISCFHPPSTITGGVSYTITASMPVRSTGAVPSTRPSSKRIAQNPWHTSWVHLWLKWMWPGQTAVQLQFSNSSPSAHQSLIGVPFSG